MTTLLNFEKHISEIDKKMNDIKCSEIYICGFETDIDDEDEKTLKIKLKVGYSVEDLNKFLSDLDSVKYDLYEISDTIGTIWFNDGTWSKCFEDCFLNYTWFHFSIPEIPKCLKSSEKFLLNID